MALMCMLGVACSSTPRTLVGVGWGGDFFPTTVEIPQGHTCSFVLRSCFEAYTPMSEAAGSAGQMAACQCSMWH